MYVYIQSEAGLWTVGFYDPTGKWHAESDHDTKEASAKRVAWLNGGRQYAFLDEVLNSGDGVYRP